MAGYSDMADPEVRFFRHVIVLPSGCWKWKGHIAPNGYPRFGLAPSKPVSAHRWIFEQTYGWSPRIVHHTCENKWCVNPDHLQGKTTKQHAFEHRSTFCKRGHAMSEENVYVHPASGYRSCKKCRRLRKQWHDEGGDANGPSICQDSSLGSPG